MTAQTHTLIAKPRKIEAFAWRDRVHPNDVPFWIWEEIESGHKAVILFDGGMTLQVRTAKGMKYAKAGDWVFMDEAGDLDVLPRAVADEQFTLSDKTDDQLWADFCRKAQEVGVTPVYTIRNRIIAELRKLEAEGADLKSVSVEWTDVGLDVKMSGKEPAPKDTAERGPWRNPVPFPTGGARKADDLADALASAAAELRW